MHTYGRFFHIDLLANSPLHAHPKEARERPRFFSLRHTPAFLRLRRPLGVMAESDLSTRTTNKAQKCPRTQQFHAESSHSHRSATRSTTAETSPSVQQVNGETQRGQPIQWNIIRPQKRNELLGHTTPWMNIEDVTLPEEARHGRTAIA